MNKLLFINQRAIDLETASIKSSVDVSELQYLIDFWKQHQLGKITHILLHKVVTDPGKVVSDIIKARIADVNEIGLKNNKEKILSQMDLPEIDKSKISRLKLFIDKGYNSFYDLGDTVKLNENRLSIYFEKYKFYCDNDEALQIFDELNVIAQQLNKINEKLNITPLTTAHFGKSDNFFNKIAAIYDIGPEGLRIQRDGFFTAVRNILKRANVTI